MPKSAGVRLHLLLRAARGKNTADQDNSFKDKWRRSGGEISQKMATKNNNGCWDLKTQSDENGGFGDFNMLL